MKKIFYKQDKLLPLKDGIYRGEVLDIKIIKDFPLILKPYIEIFDGCMTFYYSDGLIFEGEIMDQFLCALAKNEYGEYIIESANNRICYLEIKKKQKKNGDYYLALVNFEWGSEEEYECA